VRSEITNASLGRIAIRRSRYWGNHDLAVETTTNLLRQNKHGQYPGVAVKVISCDLAGGEKTDQRHVTEGLLHYLQLGMPRAEVRATASRTTDIYRARHIPCRVALHFGANLGRDADQIELWSFRVARAKSQAHARLDLLGDRQDLVLPVHAQQVAHDRICAELSGPSRHVLGCGNQANQRGGERLRQLVIRQVT